MKIIKGIALYLMGILLLIATFGFFRAYGGGMETYIYIIAVEDLFWLIPFLIGHLLLILIFLCNFESEKKEKLSWFVIFSPFVVNVILFGILGLILGGLGGGWGELVALFYAVMIVVVLFFIKISIRKLLTLEEEKQKNLILVAICLLLIFVVL